jgi:hypothetical protein
MNARPVVLSVFPLLLAVSCTERNPFAAEENFSPPPALLSGFTHESKLLECPVARNESASAEIGALGGVLEVAGHRVVIPALAVPTPVRLTMTVPASRHLEIEVTAGEHRHYTFRHPVRLSISYERCPRADIERKHLRIFYIDSESKALLEDLGGTDDKDARRVTVSTLHFSGYAVGEN